MLRLATEDDFPRIVSIYNATVPTRRSTADTEPVALSDKWDWFRRHTPSHRPILVHETGGLIAAWLSFEPFHERPAYGHTAEISIYVAAFHQGRGLGGRLLDEALRMAPGLGIKTLVALVFSHNASSLRLFLSRHFEEWGRLPDVAEMDGRDYSLSILGKRVAR
ncbi:MAG: GNAT family N-acetyltransferase [Desulfobacterales bacterium]